MRYLLALWFIPFALFWGWYGLSAYDIDLGSIFLSRDFHDHMFVIYGNMLGVEPTLVPGLIAGAFAVDSAILFGIAAFTSRKDWWPPTSQSIRVRLFANTKNVDFQSLSTAKLAREGVADPVHPAE